MFIFPGSDSRPRHMRKTASEQKNVSNAARGRLHKRAAISGNPVVTERYTGSDQMMSVHGGLTHTRDPALCCFWSPGVSAADITLIAAAGGWEGDTRRWTAAGEKSSHIYSVFCSLKAHKIPICSHLGLYEFIKSGLAGSESALAHNIFLDLSHSLFRFWPSCE